MDVIDSDVCVDLLRGEKAAMDAVGPLEDGDGPLRLTAVTVHELLEGAHRAADAAEAVERVGRSLLGFDVLPYDEECAVLGGRLAGAVGRSRRPIGDLDTMIAATALHHGGTLVTRNVRHFRRVEGLVLRAP